MGRSRWEKLLSGVRPLRLFWSNVSGRYLGFGHLRWPTSISSLDQCNLFFQSITEFDKNGDQQIDFCERDTTSTLVAEEEFYFDYVPAVGNDNDIIAEFVGTIVARLYVSLNVRS